VTSAPASPASTRATFACLRAAGAAICALVQLGCIANNDGPPAISSRVSSPETQFVPCDPNRVLQTVCQQCHTDPPRNSAPFPLVSYHDTQVVLSGNPIWVHMRNAVENGIMPLPPVTIDPASRDTLLRWLDAGAPARTASDVCSDPNADPDSGVDADSAAVSDDANPSTEASDGAGDAVIEGAVSGDGGAVEGGDVVSPDMDGDAAPE
jgi:hypothetical protein